MTTDKLQIVNVSDIATQVIQVCTRAVNHAHNLGDLRHQTEYGELIEELRSTKTSQELAGKIHKLIDLINDLDFLQAQIREIYRMQLERLLNKTTAINANNGDNVVVGTFGIKTA